LEFQAFTIEGFSSVKYFDIKWSTLVTVVEKTYKQNTDKQLSQCQKFAIPDPQE